MPINFTEEFEVKAPAGRVWEYCSDPTQVVECIPGAKLVRVVDERTYEGQVQMRVGPVNAHYSGTVTVEGTDAAGREMIMRAVGDQQGAVGHAEARIALKVAELAEALSRVTVSGELSLAGRLAQLGGGLIETVARQVFRRFAGNVQKKIGAG